MNIKGTLSKQDTTSSMSRKNIQTSVPTIIPPEGGEHLIRRWGYPLTIKVDPTTTGAKHFSMGTEIIMPGKEIPLHRHMHSEEVVVVQQGRVEAILNDKHQVIGQGGMAYAPPDTWMSFRNIFEIPATVLWIFSTPGFEEYVRETSVKKGEAVIPFTPDELTHIRKRYLQQIELSAPFDVNYPSDID